MLDRRPRILCSRKCSSVASVFIFLCGLLVVLAGCGIPSWFYVYDTSGTDYLWTISSNSDEDTLTVSLEFTSSAETSLAKIDDSSPAPSLMFFYIIDDSDSIVDYSSDIISQFSTTYKRKGSGSSLRHASDGSVLTYSTGSVDYKLFPFMYQDIGEDSAIATAPDYLLNKLDAGQTKEALKGTLALDQYNIGDETRAIYLYTGNSADDEEPLSKLPRFNGEDFLYAVSQVTSPSTTPADYDRITSSSDELYVHVFVAFNVTPSQSGDSFNNIFWSSLKYAGRIKLTPSS